MPPTQKDVLLAQRLRQQEANQKSDLPKILEQAAVQAQKLVGSPEWDTFQRQVEAKRLEYVKHALDWTEKLKHAAGMDEVKECQINVAIGERCAQLLQEIIDLPASIMKEHHA